MKVERDETGRGGGVFVLLAVAGEILQIEVEQSGPVDSASVSGQITSTGRVTYRRKKNDLSPLTACLKSIISNSSLSSA